MTDRVDVMVREFHEKFDLPIDQPTKENKELWETLLKEEYEEAIQALGEVLKELADLEYVYYGYMVSTGTSPPDGWTSKINNIYSFLGKVLGSDREFCDMVGAVHESNMTKLGRDGKPIKRKDGKILKGPDYKKADMVGWVRGRVG